METNATLTTELFRLPLFEAEWVLWCLLLVSVVSVALMLERGFFFARRAIDVKRVGEQLESHLHARDLADAERFLGTFDSLETNIARQGLLRRAEGLGAVERAMEGAEAMERLRFSRGLGFLATVGSNAPFVGLFGTVLGIIRAFQDLSTDLGSASSSVMSGISEALVATAVGLLVAIPAVVAFNALSAKVASRQARARVLTGAVLARVEREVA